jgi:RNA-directed DNA polymerase
MMAVLKERQLNLSRKKTRMGLIDKGFHFLGIHYPGPQPSGNTNITQMIDKTAIQVNNVHYQTSLSKGGGRYCNY